ncbi:uncharacterized protein Z518_02991 [Rhinocladiella mackenziei CBS 650.93]|uniref:Fungal-type protein kinase domain-containing protein n=1 Tax=Rhinocladiella mackenziei CBS 650.93 TaxID=1442369 RepID=A0A0D2JG68_9EURO|nr:uncharacterized protein Z518_02991 [Rhinocladiella mackenziei CBS 650.93]KIX08335.1 hypothetical protein Z518_02991 [Rhinocladiella mackenziei CBS 650.93]
MDDKPRRLRARPAKGKVIDATDTDSVVDSGTKKRRASAHEPSSTAKKARKRKSSPQDKGAENVSPSLHRTPSTKRMVTHASMINQGTVVYAMDMEAQIVAEVTRKNIPWDTFCSIYLSDFDAKPQQGLAVNSMRKVGEGNWEEQLFWGRLRQLLSDEALCDLKLFYGGTKTLPDANKGKEVPSKPDFVLHVGEDSPTWADVDLLFEHTRSQEAVTKKFLQWLRGAWSVFHHQPFRRHLYGIMFIKPRAYVCYADHGCAVYSEPLYFATNIQHAEFLVDFLTWFIANPGYRGRDPTVKKEEDWLHIRHAGTTWAELPKGALCYRPCLVGRNIRVALVEDQGAKFPEERMVMKSTWEEKLPPESSPPSEVEVLEILLKANVRGLPQPYALESAIVRDDGSLEVETRSFPENCEVALSAPNTNLMVKMQASYVSSHTSKPLAPGANVGEPFVPRVKIQREQFNEPLEVRRRLTRVLMSYCVPLKEAMRTRGPESLMRIIRDAMITYYEAYKLPKFGFIHGDISIENILVPIEGCVLTGGLTHKDRSGTLIDWNLCFNAHGASSSRAFKSGTPAFMAPVLLKDKQIPRRTLGHDMESFFAVIIWIATLDFLNEAAFRVKPLALVMLDNKKTPMDIVNAKGNWFKHREDFKESVTDYFERPYRDDVQFLKCLHQLREILYPVHWSDLDVFLSSSFEEKDKEVTEDADPMKEDLFRECMKKIDDYLHDTKGRDEMERIDSNALARHTPESLS